MDIELSEQQRLIQNSAHSFLAEHITGDMVRNARSDPQAGINSTWQGMAELGFMGMGISEAYGGIGGSFVDLLVLLEEMGRVTLPGPFFSTVAYAPQILNAVNNQSINKAVLPAIASGAAKIAMVIGEDNGIYTRPATNLTAQAVNNGFNINGICQFAPDGLEADYLLCAVQMGRIEDPGADIGLFCIAANMAGIERKALRTLNGQCAAKIVFNNVHVCEEDLVSAGQHIWGVLQQAMLRATVAKCAQMVGACSRIIEIAVEHAKQRRQFGKPIGSFQAIQHHCADMLTDLDSARWMMFKTGWRIDQDCATKRHMAMTKTWCNEACRRILRTGHQVMGGIGYCEEHDMPLFFRYIRMAEASLGTSDDHLAMIATDLFKEKE